jgi:hypothetical protein
MPPDESNSEASDIHDDQAEVQPVPEHGGDGNRSVSSHVPCAWQPLTPRGLAAFSRAPVGRCLLLQTIFAFLVVGAVLWFLATNWFPVVRQAMRQMPADGLIQNQQLISSRTAAATLAESRFLTFVLEVGEAGSSSGVTTDVRVAFRSRGYTVCSLLGCLAFDYPKGATVQFNPPELESWWVAWEPTIYTVTALAVAAGLLTSWLILATIHCPMVRLYAFFKDRQLTLAGSWKLAAAALLPGALLVAVGIVLYGLGLMDLIGFLVLWALHLFVGWAYLFVSPLHLPQTSDAIAVARPNPFDTPEPEPPSANPFGNPGVKKPSGPSPRF